MAKRRIIKIDGGSTLADTASSIRNALNEAGITNMPASVVTGGEIIMASDFNRPAPPHDMLLNQKPIVKGATLRDRLLDQEVELIALFLWQFDGRERSLGLDDNTLLIRAFPLPDDYSPDHIDLLFVICGYPEVPPAGVHIPAKSPNRQQIRDRLDGHVIANSTIVRDHTPASYRKYVEELAKQGWDWICYHYKDWSWQAPVDPNNLLAGDCLYKYCENVFAALPGGHRD